MAAEWRRQGLTNDREAVAVVDCESDFDPGKHSPGGTYHGLWQADGDFSRAYAGVDDAHLLSVEGQTKMASKGYKARGWRPWPHCGRARFGDR